ncbi:MAG: phosphatidylserine/phosphatidylglycerophosphate/cardiolipin synthase family protein [Woeseiaceae bacterium]|nr:phosphatidylserine/phosphatidylglycerophosphate/cardiolipin synthase family protein [Woeseiaceae bacterium]
MLALAAAVSCGASPQTDYPTDLAIEARFADEPPAEPLIAERAFLSDTAFYVRFRRDGEVRYGGGNWADQIDINDPEAEGAYLLPLQYEQHVPWQETPDDVRPIHLLGPDDWAAFRERVLAALLPVESREGLVLHLGIEDFFLYYDEDGSFVSVVIDAKPGDYAVSRRVSFNEFLGLGLPELEAFIAERGVTSRRIAFSTGDTGAYSLPFLFVNLDLPVAVFVRDPPAATVYGDGSRVAPYVQTAGHVTGSHTMGILLRPVSSVYRLLFVATDTVTQPVRSITLPVPPAGGVEPIRKQAAMDLVAWEERLDDLTGREPSKGRISYLIDGEAFFTRLIDAITQARESITLRMYIFDNDDYAARIGDLLKRRSNEGIDIKVLLDGLGTIVSTVEQQESLPEDYKAPASVREFLETGSNIRVRQAPNPWLTGDHVKTVIIDRTLAFTGGMNIAREYRYDWHDMMIELEGPIVDVLQYEFDKAWAHAGFLGDLRYFARRIGPKPRNAEDIGVPMRALFTRIDDPEIFRVQREAARSAQRYIYVENAYFTDDALLVELIRARQRGVDVRVIVPLVTDRGPITRNNILAANAMLEHGIRVYIYPGMSHVKAAVFDGWACLGSANWDRLSMKINKELNIATSDSAAVEALEDELFRRDFERSVEVTEPFPVRWSDHLLELVGDYVF